MAINCTEIIDRRTLYKSIGKLSRFIEPAVLLMLRDKPGLHGYELLSNICEASLAGSDLDAGSLYRTLRELEDSGLVSSYWDTVSKGPAKRCYKITFRGLSQLSAWAEIIDKKREEMDQFLMCFEMGR